MSSRKRHVFEFADFRIDTSERLLRRGPETVHMPPKAIDVLLVLLENNGRLVTRDELLDRVWGDSFVEDVNLSRNVFLLRKTLAAGQTSEAFIETIPRRGYRFVAPVIEYDDEGDSKSSSEQDIAENIVSKTDLPHIDEAAEQPGTALLENGYSASETSAPPAASGFRNRTRLAGILLSVLIPVATMLTAWWLYFRYPEAPGSFSIAVLPFKIIGPEADDEYIGLAMADTLIARLGTSEDLVVRPLSAVQKYTFSAEDSISIGQSQRVDAVLEGSIQRSGDRVRVNVRLLRPSDGAALWSQHYDEAFSDLFTLQDSISMKVAQSLALRFTGAKRQLTANRHSGYVEARVLYTKGVFLRNQISEENLRKSLHLFEEALAIDSGFAPAYAGKASTISVLAYLGTITVDEAELQNREYIARALSLDPDLAEGHAALAEFKLFIERDFAGAEKEFLRTLELNPNESLANHLYAALLMVTGRPDEAIARRSRAVEIDPLSPRSLAMLARDHYLTGNYDEAIAKYKEMRELFPDHVLIELGPVYEKKGMFDEAVEEYLSSDLHKGMNKAEAEKLRDVYKREGWMAFWRERLRFELKKPPSRPDHILLTAEIYARLGDLDEAFRWLEVAYRHRSMSLIWLGTEPKWEPLRRDPRYSDLIKRLNLGS